MGLPLGLGVLALVWGLAGFVAFRHILGGFDLRWHPNPVSAGVPALLLVPGGLLMGALRPLAAVPQAPHLSAMAAQLVIGAGALVAFQWAVKATERIGVSGNDPSLLHSRYAGSMVVAAVSPFVPWLVVLWTDGSFAQSAALFVSVLLGVEAAMVFVVGPLLRLSRAGSAKAG